MKFGVENLGKAVVNPDKKVVFRPLKTKRVKLVVIFRMQCITRARRVLPGLFCRVWTPVEIALDTLVAVTSVVGGVVAAGNANVDLARGRPTTIVVLSRHHNYLGEQPLASSQFGLDLDTAIPNNSRVLGHETT